MGRKEDFISEVTSNYTFKGPAITLGAAILDKEPVTGVLTKIPLKTLNRHGLIAGATGTGKTKTLQTIAEGLSLNSVPVLMMDIKGDLSGIARPGVADQRITERHEKIGVAFQPEQFPVEFLSISNDKGVRMRATVLEFGPVLFSRIMDLNDTQQGVVSLVFKYCDDNNLPLVDLTDFKKVLQYLTNEGKKEIEAEYGKISSASTGTILRKIIELEQQGADRFFGEPSFDVDDLVRVDDTGKGYISVIRLTDIQDKPKMFSTFMLSLLAEIYATFPEEGDLEQPKLVIFIDEAHLIFNEASKALIDQIESIIKLIRSKGVGIIFCTQNPTDIPDAVLSQLGLKVQHALRAFTAKDRKAIKQTSENYPITHFYQTDELLTSLGIGEAAITALNEKGVPTTLAATLLCAPRSRMNILTPAELDETLSKSALVKKYQQDIDPESAHEILAKRLQAAPAPEKTTRTSSSPKEEKTTMEKVISNPLTRQIGNTIVREVTRGLLGVLGLRSTGRRKKSGWF
jgi:uncharacterized protein